MSAPADKAGGWTLAIDYLPLIAFFLANKFVGVFAGTAVFMVAIVLAVIVSRWKLGRVSPMLWLSAILVIGFGGLTIYLHDPRFIQIKMTLIYAMFTAILVGGLAVGKPAIKYLLQAAFPGLEEAGWMKLSRNWAIFFAVMAIVNEVLRRQVGFDTWLAVKTWGLTAASIVFGAAQVPMLMRHGLSFDEVKAEPPLPPE
ncbi:septation protein IspZ [Sphingomonas nostoxanthinifaciens]|uniref:septation protein IspZ n=1 Tax=Sphingomonas nostoxanthinifaciens TaxID=2872652 RepID=UPI001CC1E88F|nr:septation protein IspZ [Sphingomonas nostoxanthinifaciens]UAK24835.1 septation protein IspZ [Sphingomonas nostoxanthinifaciens]